VQRLSVVWLNSNKPQTPLIAVNMAPMKLKLFSTGWLPLTLLLAIASPAGGAAPENVDRGPTFSGTIRAKYPADNTTMKGIVIALGTETNAFICYDTDLMRVSLAWTGDYLKFGNYMREIVHPQPPEVAGKPLFGTKPGPGWAKRTSFTDPRENGQGPLPRDWAKYRGLYLNGRQVVLSYSVGKADVLEMPGLERLDGRDVFTRTMEFKKFSGGQLLVCEPPAGTSQLATQPQMLIFTDRSNQEAPEFAVAITGDPGAVLEQIDGRITATLSGRADSVQIALMRGAEGDWKKLKAHLQSQNRLPNLAKLARGGTPRWTEPVVTQGVLATSGGDGPYCDRRCAQARRRGRRAVRGDAVASRLF
jgi:hypothetical protein